MDAILCSAVRAGLHVSLEGAPAPPLVASTYLRTHACVLSLAHTYCLSLTYSRTLRPRAYKHPSRIPRISVSSAFTTPNISISSAHIEPPQENASQYIGAVRVTEPHCRRSGCMKQHTKSV
mmetsp:Transcript_2978/g.5822  ORF Transcript_2978/g.5822 Transcript_2978/m.5822 type:complete len:121 (+) Transcript_2978:284-646(+)